jgi:ribosomal protein S18 acetylase RimI-like enzyme
VHDGRLPEEDLRHPLTTAVSKTWGGQFTPRLYWAHDIKVSRAEKVRKFIVMITNIHDGNTQLLEKVRGVVDGPFKDPSLLKTEARKYAAGRNCLAIVYCEGAKALGYIECKLEEPELPPGAPQNIPELNGLGHIARLGVVEEARHRGIAKKLVKLAEDWFRSQGKSGIWLDYLAGNEARERLYKEYKLVIQFEEPVKGGQRKIVMKRW